VPEKLVAVNTGSLGVATGVDCLTLGVYVLI